jgi:hypothetical protein
MLTEEARARRTKSPEQERIPMTQSQIDNLLRKIAARKAKALKE